MQHSAFSQGITDAKLGITDNKFKDDPQKTWWEEGYEVATNPKYANEDGVLLKDKPVYENIDGYDDGDDNLMLV